MTNKDQSKYPYDRSEYVVMPPIRKAEDGTLTTEQQPEKVIDWAGLDKIRKSATGKTLDQLNAWSYANDTRKAGDNAQPEKLDVEALKFSVLLAVSPDGDHTEVSGAESLMIGKVINHLASAGRLKV